MLTVDKCLSFADETDKALISGLISDLPTEKLSELCFLTDGGVKYRIKKIVQNCGAENREVLVALLKKYIVTK